MTVQVAERDFSLKTLRALLAQGIYLRGITVIPDPVAAMPFASGCRGYLVNDNGTGRVWNHAEVMRVAG